MESRKRRIVSSYMSGPDIFALIADLPVPQEVDVVSR